MSKTETFNELAKPPIKTELLLDIGHMTAQLQLVNQESIKQLSAELNPLATAMATLIKGASRSISDIERAGERLTGEVRFAEAKAKSIVETMDQDRKQNRFRMFKITIGLSVLSSIITASIFCVWLSHFSAMANDAESWQVFLNQVLPQLTQKERDPIDRVFRSSKKR